MSAWPEKDLSSQLKTLIDNRPGLLIILMVLGCWGVNIFSPLGIIDDHEIVHFLGSDQQLAFSEIPQLLLTKTEVGQWGTATRYRPVYYLGRLVEIALWGGNSYCWYFFRLLIAIGFFWQLFTFLQWLVRSRLTPGLENQWALFFLLLIMYRPFWRDIFCRLGPAEIYAIAGATLVGNAVRRLWGEGKLTIPIGLLSWAQLTIGGLIMIGSKENMLIVLVLLFSALWWSKSRKLLFILMTSLGLQVLFAGFIASGLFFAIKHNGGRDIYGQQREISSVAIQLWQMVHWKNIYWIVGIVALGFFQWRKQNFSFQKTDQHLFFLVVVLIVGYFSQVFFYGHFPYKSRYDFPGELFKYFAIYITVLFAWPLLADTMVRRINKYFIGITIIMVVLTIHRHLPASIKNVQINRGFATQLQQFVAYANSHAKQAIIFFTERIEWDIEPVVSVGRYLSFYQVVNPMMFHPLEPILPGSEKDTDLARQLEANYNKMVQEGGEELVPFNAQAMQNANCIGVVVKKAVTKWQPACEKFFSPW